MPKTENGILVSIAQASPIWLNKKETINKTIDLIEDASGKDADLIVFGESYLPGYPYWLSTTGGANFNNQIQKEIFTHYFKNSIDINRGDLEVICKTAKENSIAVYIGITEIGADRAGKTLYCSLIYIDKDGDLKSVHRKLMPTYEERLVWGTGDGNGLKVHKMKDFTLGGLNCWENWMPLPRASLYGLGEDVHIAVWPGSKFLTEDITRFVAKESRSFMVSASSFLNKNDIPKNIPHYDLIYKSLPDILSDGGSCIAKPDGTWLIEPATGKEELLFADLDFDLIIQERQNFDPSGHYSRPDIFNLQIHQERQKLINFE